MNKKDVVKEDKVFPLTLKNGIVVELTTQDIIENNISKLESVVPELRFVNRVSDRNPLKKVITVLETGIQSQYKYYKYLSFLFYVIFG